MNAAKALKLRADDDEDLAIIAACLHGAICCLGEMAYDREARRFAAILVRPLWELELRRWKRGSAVYCGSVCRDGDSVPWQHD